ncbi:MAG: RluA family pseudouridine synthase [Spirochaetota bacterium]
MQTFSTIIQGNAYQKTLLAFLEERFTYLSGNEWEQCICLGRVLVNGQNQVSAYHLQVGDSVEFLPGDLFTGEEPEVDTSYQIIYEDEYLFAVDKPGNLPVHPTARYKTHNLVSLLQKTKDYRESYLVHRLDRETSGIVLFSKQKEFTHKLARLFQNRKITKTYLVYVWGSFPIAKYTKGYILADHKSQVRKKKLFSWQAQELGKYAATSFFKVEEKYGISRLLAQPYTGRLHQIRATLCSLPQDHRSRRVGRDSFSVLIIALLTLALGFSTGLIRRPKKTGVFYANIFRGCEEA